MVLSMAATADLTADLTLPSGTIAWLIDLALTERADAVHCLRVLRNIERRAEITEALTDAAEARLTAIDAHIVVLTEALADNLTKVALDALKDFSILDALKGPQN